LELGSTPSSVSMPNSVQFPTKKKKTKRRKEKKKIFFKRD
jgi:hypothetical protein